MTEHLILYDNPISGHCYKIRLTAALLGIALERKHYDIMAGETRRPEFLSNINPAGRVPVLQIGDRFLPESNAACLWLADESTLIPKERFARANMLRWMFFEQNEHEPHIATVRYWKKFVGLENLDAAQLASLPAKQSNGLAALQVMESHLSQNRFFAKEAVSVADIALYAYTHIAGDGGFDLTQFPAITQWMADIAALPDYISMENYDA